MHIVRTVILAAVVAAAFAGCGKGGGYMRVALQPTTASTSVQAVQAVGDSRNAR